MMQYGVTIVEWSDMLFQLPIFISVYTGLREMAELPVASMTTGGLLWFTDLTIADPYYALPLMTAATLLVTIEVRKHAVITSAKEIMCSSTFVCLLVGLLHWE